MAYKIQPMSITLFNIALYRVINKPDQKGALSLKSNQMSG
jgi:hypothetical protein